MDIDTELDRKILSFVEKYAKVDKVLKGKVNARDLAGNVSAVLSKLYVPKTRYREILDIVGSFTVSTVNAKTAADLKKLNVNVVEDEADFHLMIPGDTEIKEAKKYIFCVILDDGDYSKALARIKYGSTGELMTSDQWDEFSAPYWILSETELPCETIYVARTKPDIPIAVEKRLSFLKGRMMNGFHRNLLNIDFEIERIAFISEVNSYLASVFQEWMKNPTLNNWMEIESRFFEEE